MQVHYVSSPPCLYVIFTAAKAAYIPLTMVETDFIRRHEQSKVSSNLTLPQNYGQNPRRTLPDYLATEWQVGTALHIQAGIDYNLPLVFLHHDDRSFYPVT